MRVITLNVNGLRAAHRKGLMRWLAETDADVVCIQEVRARLEQLPDALRSPDGYCAYFHEAERKGYSGVAAYARNRPDRVRTGLGWDSADREGRYLQLDYGDLSIASLYLPSGSHSEERQELKFDFMARFMPVMKRFRAVGRHYILCGDWNIAHRKIDLENWRGNQKNSGFLPEERAWMDQALDKVGLVDAFRHQNPEGKNYTWWSNRGRAWEKNVGWRIDYQIVTPGLAGRIERVAIYKERRFSDHAPLIIDYGLSLPGRR